MGWLPQQKGDNTGLPLLNNWLTDAFHVLQVQSSRREIQKVGAVTSSSGGAQGGWTKSELQLAKTLFIIFVVFLCCWSPYAVVVLIDYNDRWPKVSIYSFFYFFITSPSYICKFFQEIDDCNLV